MMNIGKLFHVKTIVFYDREPITEKDCMMSGTAPFHRRRAGASESVDADIVPKNGEDVKKQSA